MTKDPPVDDGVALGGAPPGSGLEIGQIPSPRGLYAFAMSAREAGMRLVVGALITDGAGRLFVQRRAQTRELFPGAWDMVGGHAEAGEDVLSALSREVLEETGWRLAEVGPVVELIDWRARGEWRREVDLLVTVDGDLSAPVMERGKHDAWRWLERGETALLAEGRGGNDTWLESVAERALRLISETGFGASR